MKRTRLLAVLAIAMVTGLLFTGCQDPMDFDSGANIAWHWVNPPEVHTLWAGQHINAGTVTVWSTRDTLYIKYDMADNWWLEETHAHVALTPEGIPQTKKGNPIPGKFEFKDDWDPRVQTCTYAIAVRPGWDVEYCLSIATHAVAVKVVRGKVTKRETGWAGEEEFPGKNWALYFRYCRKISYKDVNLPDFDVKIVSQPGDFDQLFTTFNSSYWLVTLSGTGYSSKETSPYDVWDGVWRGWCGEYAVEMVKNTEYTVRLWSSIDPGLPDRCKDPMWDNINYLLNHTPSEATGWEFQVAVWALKGDLVGTDIEFLWYIYYPLAKQMYDDALAYGDGWYPSQGDWIAVVVETPEEVQLCFIEVDP